MRTFDLVSDLENIYADGRRQQLILSLTLANVSRERTQWASEARTVGCLCMLGWVC